MVEAIQTLHGLTFNTYGRLAVVNVISKGDLLDILIRFSIIFTFTFFFLSWVIIIHTDLVFLKSHNYLLLQQLYVIRPH